MIWRVQRSRPTGNRSGGAASGLGPNSAIAERVAELRRSRRATADEIALLEAGLQTRG